MWEAVLGEREGRRVAGQEQPGAKKPWLSVREVSSEEGVWDRPQPGKGGGSGEGLQVSFSDSTLGRVHIVFFFFF